MEFHLTQKQSVRVGQWTLPQPEGELICYEESPHYRFLPRLLSALEQSKWPLQFHGYFYRLRTNAELIEEFVPASEHYKISWRAMSQKFHGALQTLSSVESIIQELQDSYPLRRTTVGEHNQPMLIFSNELYRLRTDFSTLLFLIRSILDQFASLIQFLSGPKSSQFKSFADIMKKCKRSDVCPEIPPKLHTYLRANGDWFFRMRDVRDYIAHHGFVSLTLMQSPSGNLKFYIHDRIEMLEMAREFMREFRLLLEALDENYSQRISDV